MATGQVIMIEWVEEFRRALAEEFGTGPQTMTLATVDDSGRPRARTVVCRRVEDDGRLFVASDARSAKNRQVDVARSAEACFWLAKLRRQFRLHGTAALLPAVRDETTPVTILGADPRSVREQVWKEMSESARALFYWPPPGEVREADDAAFPPAVRTGLPPDNFELIVLAPVEVELLELRGHPHRRRRWSRTIESMWELAELNP